MKDTFETIERDKRLIYSYIRGSQCHGLATPLSDIDKGGVFIADKKDLLDLGLNYQGQVANETNDIVWYELKKFMTLLIKSNPTILEALFVDDKFVEVQEPIMDIIKANKDEFLTKKCFPSFFSYAKSQIEKAKGLNKMINWDKDKIKRKGILDFTYTFYNQGSTKIVNWLEYRGLDQKYCGLVNIPNMKDIYGVYYDWGKFFEDNEIPLTKLEMGFNLIECRNTATIFKRLSECNDEKEKELLEKELKESYLANMVEFIVKFYNLEDKFGDIGHTIETLRTWYKNQKPIGYSGMVGENSQALRLSSVSKGEKPICYASYNKDGYIKHCIDYRNYQDWVKHRNPIRYESNLNKNYDAKNMCECFRLMHCGIEIANGEGYIVDRSGIDADFLLDVKNHKYEYDELMERLKEDKEKMEIAMAKSTLKDDIDQDFVNELYYEMIKKNYL